MRDPFPAGLRGHDRCLVLGFGGLGREIADWRRQCLRRGRRAGHGACWSVGRPLGGNVMARPGPSSRALCCQGPRFSQERSSSGYHGQLRGRRFLKAVVRDLIRPRPLWISYEIGCWPTGIILLSTASDQHRPAAREIASVVSTLSTSAGGRRYFRTHTRRPPIQVSCTCVLRITCGSVAATGSRSSSTKSAMWPGSSEPSRSSARAA